MENMNSEIIDAVIEYFDDGNRDSKDLIKDCLMWIKENSKDNMMSNRMSEWFIQNGYCEICGSKLELREYSEIHTELYGHPVEKWVGTYCPNCD